MNSVFYFPEVVDELPSLREKKKKRFPSIVVELLFVDNDEWESRQEKKWVRCGNETQVQ